jgi:hypothetical protein
MRRPQPSLVRCSEVATRVVDLTGGLAGAVSQVLSRRRVRDSWQAGCGRAARSEEAPLQSTKVPVDV